MAFNLEDFMIDVTAVLKNQYHPESSGSNLLTTGIDGGGEQNPLPAGRQILDSSASRSVGRQPSTSHDSERNGLLRRVVLSEDDMNKDAAGLLSEAGNGFLRATHPDVDMSTALSVMEKSLQPDRIRAAYNFEQQDLTSETVMPTERIDLVPNLYSYSVRACLLPIRKVQNDLFTLYFQHIHPMFPVVDEFYFTTRHRQYRGHEEFMDPADFMVYHAIIVAGFAHLTDGQLHRTPYRSIYDGQEALFDQVKARYWSQITTNPVVLTQIALILSLWSPGRSNHQNNGYWLDMAFKHADAAKLWDLDNSSHISFKRQKLLCWCCLVRDRVLALGMRRPHRVHNAPFGNIPISEEDFGQEAQTPSHADLDSKRVSMVAFIWFCKLSVIMAAIAAFQHRIKFSRDWNGGDLEVSPSELGEVRTFHCQLESWGRQFEAALSEIIDSGVPHASTPVSTLRIVYCSLLGGLYQPYLNFPLGSLSISKVQLDPLQMVKKAAQGVASIVAGIAMNQACDTVPLWILSWITLPVTVYHVNATFRRDVVPDKILMPFLRRLMRRSSGAQTVSLVLWKTTKELAEKQKAPMSRNPSTDDFYQQAEAKFLASVTKVIDSALERHGTELAND